MTADTVIKTPEYEGPDRRQKREEFSASTVEAAVALLQELTAQDIIAVHQAHKEAAATVGSKSTQRTVLTAEEKRLRKNEYQRALRSTPEGRAYANEASKKSIAAKKRAEAVKALIAERIAAQLAAK